MGVGVGWGHITGIFFFRLQVDGPITGEGGGGGGLKTGILRYFFLKQHQ